jgi:hypothetical protein
MVQRRRQTRPRESTEQERVVLLLRAAGVTFFSVPNERTGGAGWGKLQRMGARAGVADLIVVAGEGWPNISLEMKRPGEKLRENQKAWREEIGRAPGWLGLAAFSAEEAVQILRACGVPLPPIDFDGHGTLG